MSLCTKHNIECDVEGECSTCGGRGEVWDDDPGMCGGYVRCWSCLGDGMSRWPECPMCLDEEDLYSI